MEPLTIVNNLRIASPCRASWEAMRGDERVRFCDLCSKQVYNISDLTADAAVALIRESEGRFCVRLFRRKDGTVLTADCPVGLRSALRRRLLRLATAGIVVFVTLRSGVWLLAGPRREIPPLPTGLGVTFSDWADWAARAVGFNRAEGFKKQSANPVALGGIRPPALPSLQDPDDCEAEQPGPFPL